MKMYKNILFFFGIIFLAVPNFSRASLLDSDEYAEFKEEQEIVNAGEDFTLRETLQRFARAVDKLYQKVDELDQCMMID